MAFGDISRVCSPPCRNRACEAMASFSSFVNGTKGRTVVTREINEAYIGSSPQSSEQDRFSSSLTPRHSVTSGLNKVISSMYSFLSIAASESSL